MPKRVSERTMVRRATPMVFGALHLCQDACRFIHELTVGHSTADLVILRAKRTSLWPGAPLSITECSILSCLRRHGEAHVDTIAKEVYMRPTSVQSLLLGRLSAWGLARSTDERLFRPSTTWVDRSELIAVEAKLTRWREALAQAAVYRRYADRAYVLLPAERAEMAVEHRFSFIERGVGLLSYDSTGVRRIFSSPKVTEHTWHREFAISRVR